MKTTKTASIRKSVFLMLSVLSIFFLSGNIQAQDIEIRGIVKGKTTTETEILNGANIFLKGTKTGTTSNKKGEFTFPKKLKTGDILVVSYLGYITKRIKINNDLNYVTIVLNEDDNQMLGALNSNKIYKSKPKKH